jgi:hypothetical protein
MPAFQTTEMNTMVKEIVLTKGKITIVDDKVFAELDQHNWHVHSNRTIFYAQRSSKRTLGKHHPIRMHRVIMEIHLGRPLKSKEHIDHINNDGLDNRLCNLRVCTNQQNLMNRGKNKNNTSGYKGVSWFKRAEKWTAQIWYDGESIHLGYFVSKEDAARAYDKKAKELYGEFAVLYFPRR